MFRLKKGNFSHRSFVYWAFYATDKIGFLVFTHAMKKEGFLPLIANMLFVSINFSLEKVAFMNSSCCVIFDLNKFAYVR